MPKKRSLTFENNLIKKGRLPLPSSSNVDRPRVSSVDSFRRQTLKNSVTKSPTEKKKLLIFDT